MDRRRFGGAGPPGWGSCRPSTAVHIATDLRCYEPRGAMSCGSPMPRGERIAKPAEWCTPIRPVFHSLRGEPNPEASMRTRFALVALAVALSTACGEGPLVPTSGAIRIVLTTIGADPDADGY